MAAAQGLLTFSFLVAALVVAPRAAAGAGLRALPLIGSNGVCIRPAPLSVLTEDASNAEPRAEAGGRGGEESARWREEL